MVREMIPAVRSVRPTALALLIVLVQTGALALLPQQPQLQGAKPHQHSIHHTATTASIDARRTDAETPIDFVDRLGNEALASRRAILHWGIYAAIVATTAVATPSRAATAPSSTQSPPDMAMVNTLLQKLHDIPTFCLIDQRNGAAYMAYQSDLNMAVGYAFVTFPGALAVLKDAQKVAQEKNYFETWEPATITTLPLDIAIRLTLKKRLRTSQKEQSLDTLLQVIPGADERLDGIAIDSRFKDQGKVPLFYIASDTAPVTQLYFSRLDLVAEWQRQNPNNAVKMPMIQVVDLVGIFEGLLRGRTIGNANLDLSKVSFIANPESVSVAAELKAQGTAGTKEALVPYNPNLMIV